MVTKMNKFNFMGSRWSGIEPETNKSMKEKGYVLITRKPSYWKMKKQGGQMATAIDVKPENLPISVQSFAQKIVDNY